MATDKEAPDTRFRMNLHKWPQVGFAVVYGGRILGWKIAHVICLGVLGGMIGAQMLNPVPGRLVQRRPGRPRVGQFRLAALVRNDDTCC